MKKYLCFSFLVLFFMAACSLEAYEDDDQLSKEEIEANKPLSETWNVIPENYYALNVVYYVPSDQDTLTLWWKRLSGLTLHAQSFFETGMVRNGYNKTFGLMTNDSNQNYIEVNHVRSEMAAADMKEERLEDMAKEVLAYFAEHPDRKYSDHYLVWMPDIDVNGQSFIKTTYVDVDGTRTAVTFAACDTEKFDPKFLESGRGRVAYLGDLSKVLYELMHNFYQTDNNGSMNNSRFSLTGYLNNLWNYTRYTEDMNTVILTEADAAGLNYVQVFNSQDEYNYVPAEEVEITRVYARWKESELEWPIYERDTMEIIVQFNSPQELAGVILYVDPWSKAGTGYSGTDSLTNVDTHSPTTMDAVAYWCPAEDFYRNNDEAYFQIRWSDLHQANLNSTGCAGSRNQFFEDPGTLESGLSAIGQTKGYYRAELRFRFITTNGGVYPDPVDSPKGEWGTPYRNYFRIWRYWNREYFGVNMFDKGMPDMTKRYGEQDDDMYIW